MQLPRVRPQTTPGSRQNPENSASILEHHYAPLICKDFPQGETRTGSSTSIEEVEGQCAAVLTQSYTHNSQQFPCVGKSENLNINWLCKVTQRLWIKKHKKPLVSARSHVSFHLWAVWRWSRGANCCIALFHTVLNGCWRILSASVWTILNVIASLWSLCMRYGRREPFSACRSPLRKKACKRVTRSMWKRPPQSFE